MAKKGTPYTDSEKAIVKENFPKKSWSELIKMLPGRSRASISSVARDLFLERPNFKRGKSWKDEPKEKIEELKSKFPTASEQELRALFPHRSWPSIYEHASTTWGLNRSKPAPTKESSPTKPPIEEPKILQSRRMLQLFGAEQLKLRKLPKSSVESPTRVEPKKHRIYFGNGLMIGAKENKNPESNQITNLLRVAEEEQADAIVLSYLLYMLTQRYGNQRPLKTGVSGWEVDPKMTQESYPEAIQEAIKEGKMDSVEKRLKDGGLIYASFRQRLKQNIEMVRRAFRDKNGKPLYSGPIKLVLGKFEDELVTFYANEFSRVYFFTDRTEAEELKADILEEYAKATSDEERQEIAKKIADVDDWLNIYLRMSNIADQSVNHARETALSYFIEKLEEAIPNSVVVSAGDAWIRSGDRLLMVTMTKDRKEFAGKLVQHLIAKTQSYSKGRNPKHIPDVILGMGMNPCFDMEPFTYQESDKRGHKKMALAMQLPIMSDSDLYRDYIREHAAVNDPITKTVLRSGFESGAVSLEWQEDKDTPNIYIWTSRTLTNPENFRNNAALQAMIDGTKEEHRLIYFHNDGCSHEGAGDKVLYRSPNDPNHRLLKTKTQVEWEYLIAADAPVHIYTHNGDIDNAFNHPYDKYEDPDVLRAQQQVEKYDDIANASISNEEKLKRLMELGLEQKYVGGIFTLEGQMESYASSLEKYLPYILGILQRSKRAGISFRGRLSLVMHIMGNHIKNSFKDKSFFISDAKFITLMLKLMLQVYLDKNLRALISSATDLSELKKLADEVFKTKNSVTTELTAPNFAYLGEGRGALLVNGQRRYAVMLKHKQGNMDATQKRAQRRNVTHHEVGLPIVNISGDNHKGGVRVNRDTLHVKTGCGQGYGPFGAEIDFPEPNVFSVIAGVPVGGFGAGPIAIIILDTKTMRKFAENPFKVDRKKIFRNPL